MTQITPQEIDQRARVVKEALAWCGTPYRHMGGTKGVAADCGMLLVRVFVEAGLVEDFDPRPYPADWHMHRAEERYLGFVLDRTAQVEVPLFGDVVVFRHGRTYSHGGVVISWPMIVHASAPARCVLLEDISKSPYVDKPRQYYSYWSRSGLA